MSQVRQKLLSEFVNSSSRKWKTDDNGIVEVMIHNMPFIDVETANGQASRIKIKEPSSYSNKDRSSGKIMSLRIFNIMSYSMYYPLEVIEFLIREFPSISKQKGLNNLTPSDLFEKDVENLFEYSNTYTDNQRIFGHSPGMETVVDVLQTIDKKSPTKQDILRNYIYTHSWIVGNSDHYSVKADGLKPQTKGMYITSGKPVKITLPGKDATDW